MEPLIPHRPSFEKDLHNVAKNFSAYRYHLDEIAADKDISLVAYILRSNAERRRTQAHEALLGTAHRIFDLSRDAEQRAFIDDIRAVGRSKQLDLEFP